MFHAADLLAGARAPRWRPSTTDPVSELLAVVRGRRRGVEVPNAPPLFLARDPKRLKGLEVALEPYRDDPTAMAAIAHTLIEGDALFVGPTEAEKQRTYHLASVVLDDDDAAKLVELRLTQLRHPKAGRDTTCKATVAFRNAHEETVRACMRSIFQETENASKYILHRGRTRAPVAYWAGAPRDPDSLPEGWAGELAALAAIDGYELRVDLMPQLDLTRSAKHLHDARPELVLLWRPMLSSAKVVAHLSGAAGVGTRVHEIDTVDVSEVLEEAELVFEMHTVAFELLLPSAPKSVAEAVEFAESGDRAPAFPPDGVRSGGRVSLRSAAGGT